MAGDWRNAPGPGDLWHPPDDDYYGPEEDPIETIFRFERPRVVNGRLVAVMRMVEVETETHKVVSYGGRVLHRVDFYKRQVRKWAAKHPKAGPRVMELMEAIK